MASLLGFGKKKNVTQNGVFIQRQMMPLMLKLHKETKGRRYKEVHVVMKDSLDALLEFEKEEWPPKKTTVDPASQNNGPAEETGASGGTQATANSNSDHRNYDAESSNSRQTPKDGDGGGVDDEDDDPQTREPVHRAVRITLEAFIAVLGHPAKQAKAMEYCLEGIALLVNYRYVSGRAGGRGDDSGSNPAVVEQATREGRQPPHASRLHRLMEGMARCCDSTTEPVQSQLIRSMTAIMTSPKCGVHESSMLLALRSTFHVYLVSKSQAIQDAAKTALMDMLRSVMGRMEAQEAFARMSVKKTNGSQQSGTTESEGDDQEQEQKHQEEEGEDDSPDAFPSQYHADSYFLFRSLCKMSSKELEAENDAGTQTSYTFFNIQAPSSDPMSLNGKILSLELILAAINFGGDAFCSSTRFVYLVQHYLCNSLLKNCMSNHTQVAFLSQMIFLELIKKFKGHMKREIEVFMSNVFFYILSSPLSSFKQKALVLESLRSLCKDPVLLTQTFLNYDCDFQARNLYNEIVHMLTKYGGKATSTPPSSQNKKDAEQEAELSLAGLEVLTTILKAFLKALGLPGGGDDDEDNDTAGARIRKMLQLNIGMAAKTDAVGQDSGHKVESDDLSQVSSETSASKHSLPDSADTSSSANAAGKIVDAFELKRSQEQTFEIGAVKFTLSLKSGLNFFISNGFVERDAKSIARFFLANKERLDKTQMGEVLGREPDAAFVKGDDIDPERGGPGFFVRILHHYVEALDFAGLMFDDGIRLFLSGFRLPGEAQKIDRIMEKFAQRYATQNPEIFPSADTAFILAFSVIMLNTDLHNPSIKPERRMTVESFIRNNSGIGENGSDLPEDFLVGIFDRIKKSPFSLKEDDAARERAAGAQKQVFEASVFFENSVFGQNAEEKRREKFKQERDEILAATKQLARKRLSRNAKATAGRTLADSVAPADVVKPMFDVTWGPMLGILSQVLECSDEDACVAVCLNGFVYAVRIAAHSHMSLARNTFVSSLAKFTCLGSVKEMKTKNIESIRTLLSIAVVDGEYLGESWGPVLQCISQVARLRLTASGLDSDVSFLTDNMQKAKKPPPTPAQFELFRAQPTRSELAREAEENNAQAILEAFEEVLIDKVFSSTTKLSGTSLAHFIEQLITVSSTEIAGNSKSGITGVDPSANASGSSNGSKATSNSSYGDGPSIFSLQKLVEVADYNMDVRPRLVWQQVWEMMAKYFAQIACNKNMMVSVFAIDSLKQLSAKFLEKPELSDFNFQYQFLHPFLVVMEDKGTSEDIREMILQCIDHLIQTKSHNFRSGWKIVFSILHRAACDPSEKIDFMGLSILQRLLDEHLEELCKFSDREEDIDRTDDISKSEERNRNANVEDFVTVCRASLAFARQEESDSPRPIGLSMRAFSHTAIYADLLADSRVLPPVSGVQSDDPQSSGYTYSGLSEDDANEMALWRPLFEGLADCVRSSAKSSAGGVGCLLQRSSILAFRAILLRHGHLFTTSQWAAILQQTLLPAIQDGCENDTSPVAQITSESPSISSIDFIVESPPRPPAPDDESLVAFKTLHSAPNRCVGHAELMLEASFSDLRYGGDGDLRKAYALAKKDATSAVQVEQPFPDSWIATTASIALGLLTDIASEIVLHRGREGRDQLWPLIVDQYRTWCLGRIDRAADGKKMHWNPCEALVRISCGETDLLSKRIANAIPDMDPSEAASWSSAVLNLFSGLISESVQSEKLTQRELVRSKEKALNNRKGQNSFRDTLDDGVDSVVEKGVIVTAFGKGKVLEKREEQVLDDLSGKKVEIVTQVLKLPYGTLYQPSVPSASTLSRSSDKRIPSEVSVPSAYWTAYVPDLKVRCISAHLLQQSLFEAIPSVLPFASHLQVSAILESLNYSRVVAEVAMKDEDVSTAFQEALLNEWGDGVAAVEEALDSAARLSHLHGSGMFFLTQEASATAAVVRILSVLYSQETEYSAPSNVDQDWDRVTFAEPHLLENMVEVHRKFLESERKDGHLIDPHVWRQQATKGNGSGGGSGGSGSPKIALYCTCFAPVMVEILKAIRNATPQHFAENKQTFFSITYSLIPVQSEEIRQLVSQILAVQVAPLIGVKILSPGKAE